jgi:hypothetical protein
VEGSRDLGEGLREAKSDIEPAEKALLAYA